MAEVAGTRQLPAVSPYDVYSLIIFLSLAKDGLISNVIFDFNLTIVL